MANKKVNKLANADTVKPAEDKSEETQAASAPVSAPAAEATASAKTETKAPAAKDKKPAVKKASEKDTENFFIEFGASKFSAEEIIEKCKAAYKADNSRKQIRTIKVYVKPEDNKAYYVINGKADGLYIDL